MVNYLLGVNWEDGCRFTIIDLMDEEKRKKGDESQSQTDWITCYTVNVPDTTKKNYILNIIDTPGFGDTRGIQRDQATVDQIKDFFTMPPPQGIETLDAVCFVTQAPLARLTPHQTYIFDSILSIFGNDISNNIFVLITFADGNHPPVIKALEAAKEPFKASFVFNNSALFVSTDKPEEVPYGPLFWNMGKTSFKVFFDELDKTESKSLQLTAEVLKARKRLEATIHELQPQIQEGLHAINQMKQEKLTIDQHIADIEANKEFEYTVEEIHQRKVDLATGFTTNCLICNRTCHYPCKIPNDNKKRDCSSMDRYGNCTSCPKRCIWSQHVNNPYRFEFFPEKVSRTSEDLKKKFVIARDKERQHSIYLQQVKVQFNQVCGNVFALIKQARQCINELNEKALKQNPLGQVEYIELLIEAEKREGKFGWQKRVDMLEAFKKQAELLKEIPNQEFKPWTDEEFEVLLQESDYDKGKIGIHAISEKTILVVGAIGSGKRTLIDGMSQPQTDWITCYTVHVPDTRKANYILNIIDTPGFGDTSGIQQDQAIVHQIKNLVAMPSPQVIETVDAGCLVTQAPLARLTPHQAYIFDYILSIFGKDMYRNIFVLITFADGTDPPVIKALKTAKVPFTRTFKFDNSVIFASTERPEKVPFGPMFWNMGMESFKAFFGELDKTETKSLQLTTDVLNARKRLEFDGWLQESDCEKGAFGATMNVTIAPIVMADCISNQTSKEHASGGSSAETNIKSLVNSWVEE